MSSHNNLISGFHHLALRGHDFEATVNFYREGLGFKERFGWGEGNERVVLLDTGDGNYMEIFAGGPAAEQPEGAFFHVAFRTDNVDKAVEAAVKAGAEITVEPKEVTLSENPPTTVKIAFVKGLNGESIEFFKSTGENKL